MENMYTSVWLKLALLIEVLLIFLFPALCYVKGTYSCYTSENNSF